jgi:hypothetical protein
MVTAFEFKPTISRLVRWIADQVRNDNYMEH